MVLTWASAILTRVVIFSTPYSRLNQATLLTELQKYCYYDASIPYTRNLIATDDVNYTLLLLCWNDNATQRSPIHNHPGDGCYMRVLSGTITEQLYRVTGDVSVEPTNAATSPALTKQHRMVPSDRTTNGTATTATLECIATHQYTTNQVAFINDAMGYHSIGCGGGGDEGNDSSSEQQSSVPGAMSLHLYCPPIRHCQIVVTPSSSEQVEDNCDHNKSHAASNIYVRDSGPMYHHSEYGCRTHPYE